MKVKRFSRRRPPLHIDGRDEKGRRICIPAYIDENGNLRELRGGIIGQKEYSLKNFIRNIGYSKDYLERKLRQLGNSKLLQRFKSIFPKSYNYLRSLKSKIKL